MKNDSLWREAALPEFPPLAADAVTDVLIVGGGVFGLTTAFLLRETGRRVILIERHRVAGGDTGNTTAHLTNVTDVRPRELLRRWDSSDARRVWEAGSAAILQIRENDAITGHYAEVRELPGFLFDSLDPAGDDEESKLDEEFEAAIALGGDMVSMVNGVPPFNRRAVRFGEQATFHPVKYLAALAESAVRCGVQFYGQTPATDFDAASQSVKAGGHTIHCEQLIVATHYPLAGFAGTAPGLLFQTKVAAYSSYVIGARIPTGTVAPGIYWDSGDPYLYLRIDGGADHDYAILGGADHKTGQADDNSSAIEALKSKLMGWMPSAEIDRSWSGQVMESLDGLPYIGSNAERQFVATGFAGNGMTFGTVAAMMARDFVLQTPNSWSDLFDPKRKRVGTLGAYVAENKDFPLHLVGDRIGASGSDTTSSVAPGQGLVIASDHGLRAVHRTLTGELHSRSAICPHLGCIVQWNEVATTWDCPCHGSRFSADGCVLSAPAMRDLDPG